MTGVSESNDRIEQSSEYYTRMYVDECREVKAALMQFVYDTATGKRQDPGAVEALPSVAKVLMDYFG